MKGYVYRLTPSGTQVLREIPDVDWFRSAGDIVEFMKGPRPSELTDIEAMLDDLNATDRAPKASIIEKVVLGKGMGAYVGDSPPK